MRSRSTSSRLRHVRALVASGVAALLGVTLAVVVPAVPAYAAFAPSTLAVSKDGRGSVLANNVARFTLTATNPAGAGAKDVYNLTLRDVLDPGVTYVPGSTVPADLGNPTIVTNLVEVPAGSANFVPQQTLIWSNVADIAIGSDYTITYGVNADSTLYPVGSSFDNSAQSVGSTDPRRVPRWDATTGQITDAPTTTVSPLVTETTSVSAVEITKSDSLSSEQALLRGVHDNVSTYRLEIQNNAQAPTSGVVVVDYLPAGLEFMGCSETGTGDNSTSGEEYPGSGPLVAQACSPTPVSIATVTNPPGLTGVFTRVEWNLGALAVGEQRVITYPAAIPLRANAAWPAGTEPSATSLEQGANLDNNTGASTRQNEAINGDGLALTNTATLTGTYDGPIPPGGSNAVSEQTSHGVVAKDLRVQKAVDVPGGTFVAGGVATYSLTLQTSEYASVANSVLTDTVSNGLCPLMSQSQWDALVATHSQLASVEAGACVAGAGQNPSVNPTEPIAFDSVTFDPATGSFTTTFTPVTAIPASGEAVVIYKVGMLEKYTGGALAGRDVSAGDTFSNEVGVAGTSTPIAGTGESGPATVKDESDAEIGTLQPGITKLILPQSIPTGSTYACDGPSSSYVNPGDMGLPSTDPSLIFAPGDTVCFELVVNFADGVRTRNAVITDFLPAGTTFVSATTLIGANTLPADQVDFDDSGAADGVLTWKLGESDGGAEVVGEGERFAVRVAVTVDNSEPDTSIELVGNLMKLRAENSEGRAISLRDDVPFALAPPIPLTMAKQVMAVNGQPVAAPNETAQVKQGDTVDFTVTIGHGGTAALGTNRAVRDVEVWDILPLPFTCVDLVSSTPAVFECRDAGSLANWNPVQGGAPVTDRSVVRWTLAGPLAPASSLTLTYRLTVPAIGPGVLATNTTAVSSYQAETNTGGEGITYYPQNNIDGDVPAAEQTAPGVSDTASVTTAPAAAAKAIATAMTGTGNAIGQAVPGEVMTFTLQARVPAGLTVTNGRLTDVLPAGITLLNATTPPGGAIAMNAAAPTVTTALPAGFTVVAGGATDARGTYIAFPASYTNSTATDQLIVLTVTGRWTEPTTPALAHNTSRTNTADFTFTTTGGTEITRTGTAAVQLVLPSPTLAKAVVSPTPVPAAYQANQIVTFRLTAGNAPNRPTAYDTWVVDCLPAGLAYVGPVGTPAGTVQTGVGTGTGAAGNGCAVGTTWIGWHVGDLAAGPTLAKTFDYQVQIDPTAVAGAGYTNTATANAVTIPANRTSPTQAGPEGSRTVVSANRSVTLRIDVPTVTKEVTPNRANVGELVSYTVTMRVPAGINVYKSVLRDTVPAGLDLSTLTTTGLSCDYETLSGTLCTDVPVAAPTVSGRTVTWDVGTLAADPEVRIVTLTYTARVADVTGNVGGATVDNAVGANWAPTETGVVPGGTVASTRATARVTVTEPVFSAIKTVSNTTPEPGETFDYTVTIFNVSGSSSGPAYDVRVTDTVPVGVVIVPASLPAGVVLTGADANGAGGVLTWTIAELPVGRIGTHTYTARLVTPSSALTNAVKTNTARVTDYYSQPYRQGRHSQPPATGAGSITASATVTPDLPRVVPTKSLLTANPVYVDNTPVTWEITLTNSGTGRAYDLGATDTLPPNWSYVPGSAQIGGVLTEPVLGGTTTAGQTLTWSGILPPTSNAGTSGLAPGQTISIRFNAIPLPEAQSPTGTSLAHTNRVTATAEDFTGATGSAAGPYATGTGEAVARIATADLILDKQAGTFTAGGSGTWTLSVRNDGPDTAVGPFNLTDAIPATLTLPGGGAGAPLTITGAAGAGWNCTVTSGVVSCLRTNGAETLASGAAFPPVTVTVSVPANAVTGSTAENTGLIVGRTYDDVTDNNRDSATGTVTTSADLEMRKTLIGEMVAGQNATYRLQVANLGPSDSLAPITVTEVIPTGTTFVSLNAGAGWTCPPVPTGGSLTCTWNSTLTAPLSGPATSSTTTIDVVVSIPADRTSAVVNTASVTPTTSDPRPANNSATVTTTPTVRADLSPTKTLLNKETQPPVAGTNRQYAVTVTNNGPSDSSGVYVIDTLPAGVTWNGTWTSPDATWTCVAGSAPGTVRCDLTGALTGPVAGVHQTSTVILDVFIDSAQPQDEPLVNSVTVFATTPDPVPGNNTATDNSAVTGETDLQMVKTLQTAPVIAGQSATYHLSVINHGPSDAPAGTRVVDTLPAGLSFIPGNLPSGAGWTCTVDGQTLTCDYNAVIDDAAPNNVSPIITVPVSVAEGAQGTLINSASVEAVRTDPNPLNNSGEAPTSITERADVSITKTTATPVVIAGNTVSYTVTVTNAGPSTARGITLTEVPEPGLLLDAIAPNVAADGWACEPVTTTGVTCTLAALPVGTTTLTVTAHVDSSVPVGATLDNTASIAVTTEQYTPGTPNWSDAATITVDTLAGVSVEKSHDAAIEPVIAGTTATFTLVASNAGPSDAVGPIVITDSLPAGMTFVSSSGPWTCVPGAVTAGGQQVVCTLVADDARIPAGGSSPALQIVVAVDATSLATSLTNQAEVGTGTPQDPDVDPTDSDTVSVRTLADLAVVKSHTGEATAGEEFTWTVEVSNVGPSTSRASAGDPITVTDTLPAGTTFVSGGNADWVCAVGDPATQLVVTCVRGSDLAVTDAANPATSFPVTVLVDHAVAEGARLTNNVAVSVGLTEEPATEIAELNNSDSDPVTVVTRADLEVTKTHAPDSRATAGEEFSWTITVVNHGPSSSFASVTSPIRLTDSLPGGVSFVNASSSAFTCAAQPGNPALVDCVTTTSIPPNEGSPIVITFTGLVDSATLGDPADPAAADQAPTLTNSVAITGRTTSDPVTDNDSDTDTVPLDFAADLVMEKSHDSDVVVHPGEQVTWTLQVRNDGPSVARASADAPIVVTDTLPAGAVPVTASGPGWECTVTGQDVRCVWGTVSAPADMAVGQVAPITIVADVAPGQLEPLVNEALVTPGTTLDPELTNNVGIDEGVSLDPLADLVIVKTHDSDVRAVAGLPFAWTITVSNEGPSDSVATQDAPIVISDLLPAGVTLSNDVVSGGGDVTCLAVGTEEGRELVECRRPLTLGVGESFTVTLHVVLDSALTGDSVANTASVTGTTPEPEGPNSSTDEVPLVREADLTVVKSLVTDPVIAGESVTWEIAVTNLGPSTSLASAEAPIVVRDILPAGVSGASASGAGWSCVVEVGADLREIVTCERTDDLGLETAPIITVTGDLASGALGQLANTADVAPGATQQPAENVGPDSDEAIGEITTQADLAVTKVLSETITAGAGGTYTIQVVNLGPSDAHDVVVTDVLPDGLSFGAFADSDWSCVTVDSVVTCTYQANLGVLVSGGSTAFELPVLADASLQGAVENTAVVTSSTPDPVEGNNTSTAQGLLAELADLAVVKTTPGTAGVGETTTFQLAVSNNGPSLARGVVLTDQVPASLEIVSIAVEPDSGWECVVTDGTVSCFLAELAPGASAPIVTVTVKVLAASFPSVTNVAAVTSATSEDPATLSDNTSSATVTVPALTDVNVVKELTAPLVAGRGGQYTLTVTNSGPTPEPGIVLVRDQLPSGLTLRGWNASPDRRADCTVTDGVVTCQIVGLAVGESVTITLDVSVASSVKGTVVNTATVTAPGDSTPGSDSASGVVDTSKLPATGADITFAAMLGAMLLLIGAAAVRRARRTA